MGYTKGPWRATKIGAAVLTQGITIAHISDVRSAVTGSERLANAQLIAAAPDLLAAAEAVLAGYGHDFIPAEERTALKQAIAKAKGEVSNA